MSCLGGVLAVSESGELDAAWLGEKMGREVESACVRDFTSKQGGMSAEFLLVDVAFKKGEKSITLAIKHTSKESSLSQAQALGTAREGCFYNELASKIDLGGVPRAYFAHGDMSTGRKVVIMEYLHDAINIGVLYGPEQPNNWSIKEEITSLCSGNPSSEQITVVAFSTYARMHARLWQDEALLAYSWLRGVDFVKGEGEETWKTQIKFAADIWKDLSAQREEGKSEICWDSHLVLCIDSSFGKASWDTFLDEFSKRPWAIVQGDCHPHNAMWKNQRTPDAKLVLIDFEMIGVGSPSQEIGQYLISHMTPALRRSCERTLVQGYHKELIEALCARGLSAEAEKFSFDACWGEYVAGGAAKWIWFVPVLIKMCGTTMGQFFHDQTAAFLKDHVLDPITAPMPRF